MNVSSFPALLSGVAGPSDLSVVAWKCGGFGRLGCPLAFCGDSCLDSSLQSIYLLISLPLAFESTVALRRVEEKTGVIIPFSD